MLFYEMIYCLIVIVGIMIALGVQGWMIMTGRFGYHSSPEIPPTNNHPEMKDYKPGDRLLVASFEDYTFDRLNQLAFRKKMEELFDEPSSYEDDDEDYNDNKIRV